MRTYLTAAAVAAVALLAVGCDADSTSTKSLDLTPSTSATAEPSKSAEPVETVEPVEVVTPEPEPEPVDEPEPVEALDDETIDALFLDLVTSTYPTMFIGLPDSDVIDLASGVCEMFDIGQSFTDVVLMGVESGYEYEEIGGFIGASIAAYCPEHEGVVP